MTFGKASMAALLLGAGLATGAQAAVDVAFEHPETYTDAGLHGDHSVREREATMRALRRTMDELGQRYLRPGQSLAVTFLDIDLAGRFEPWRAFASETRFMRDVTWPRMTLRYALAENGRVIRSGEEEISDQNYLVGSNAVFSGEPLRYEKAMLEAWFKARVAADPRS